MKLQIDMMDDLPDEIQVEFLKSAINLDKENPVKQECIELIINAWRKGDTNEIEKILASEVEMTVNAKEFNNRMMEIRNANMIERITEYLLNSVNKEYFIIIGVGHIVGDNTTKR